VRLPSPGSYQVPAYAPPLRPASLPARPSPTPYPAPVHRHTGIAVLIAILVLVVMGIAGAIVVTRTGAAGPGGADRSLPGNAGAAHASVALADTTAADRRSAPAERFGMLGAAHHGGDHAAGMGQFALVRRAALPAQDGSGRRDNDEGRR
jgi:hypothetical protein